MGHGVSADDSKMSLSSSGRLCLGQWCDEEETWLPYIHLLFAGHQWNQISLVMWALLSAPLYSVMQWWFWIDVAQSWHTTQENPCCSECQTNAPKERKKESTDNVKCMPLTLKKTKEPKSNKSYFTLQLQCKLTYPFLEYGSFKDGKSDTIPSAWNAFVALLTVLLQKQKCCLW